MLCYMSIMQSTTEATEKLALEATYIIIMIIHENK